MKLTMRDATAYINSHPEVFFLKRDKRGKGFVCPLCGNGSGEDGTGLRLDKSGSGTHWKCFRCGSYGDVIDWVAMVNGLSSGSAEAFKLARDLYEIDLVPDGNITTKEVSVVKDTLVPATKIEDVTEATREYIRKCHKAINEGSEYLSWRGINPQTAAKYWFGYDVDEKAIVIPTKNDDGDIGYTLRYTEPGTKIRYKNAEGLSVGFFNYDAVKQPYPLFVVEGAFDALSILQMGFPAIGLNSGSNVELFVEMMRKRWTYEACPQKLLIAMDNDDAGRQFAKTLIEGLEGLKDVGKRAVVVNISGDFKDANSLLQSDSEALRVNLNRAYNPDVAEDVDAHKVGSLMPGFKAYTQDIANNHSIPTGFKTFNKAIGGGLFPKLYVVGAISSLGKTTFCLQMADSIAERGHDVIIFSLEMSKEDILARSISRHTYLLSQEYQNDKLAKTEWDIMAAERYSNYTEAEKDAISRAYSNYMAYADERISIYEGKRTAEQIRDDVETYIKYTGRKPTIFVDYLQILQPPENMKRATVREQVDFNIEIFTAMRRELKIPVVVVSAFNRNSYNSTADNTSFKESGGIEYSSDTTITLEPDVKRDNKQGGFGATNGAKSDTLAAMRGTDNIRAIKLTFQKNRGNRVGSTIYYTYDPRYNYFEEDPNKTGMI